LSTFEANFGQFLDETNSMIFGFVAKMWIQLTVFRHFNKIRINLQYIGVLKKLLPHYLPPHG